MRRLIVVITVLALVGCQSIRHRRFPHLQAIRSSGAAFVTCAEVRVAEGEYVEVEDAISETTKAAEVAAAEIVNDVCAASVTSAVDHARLNRAWLIIRSAIREGTK